MLLKQTNDMKAVKEFMMLPEIYDFASEDGAEKDIECQCGPREAWLIVKNENGIYGIINVHIESGVVAFFHPYILRQHKAEFNHMVTSFLKWFDENMPEEIQKLNAHIPVYATGAMKAAIDTGFSLEGIDRMSWRKNNRIWDRWLIGITRGEIRG